MAGAAVPLLLKSLNIDPAMGSGVLVTTCTDVCPAHTRMQRRSSRGVALDRRSAARLAALLRLRSYTDRMVKARPGACTLRSRNRKKLRRREAGWRESGGE